MKMQINIIKKTILFSATILLVSSCQNEKITPEQPKINSKKILIETDKLGEAMNFAVDKKIASKNARLSQEDAKDIELDMVNYITTNYDASFDSNYVLLKEKLSSTFNPKQGGRLESSTDIIDANFSNPKVKDYLNRISYGLVPAMMEFRQKSGDTTNFDNFKSFYNIKLDSIISEINSDSKLEDSTKLSLIYSCSVQKSTVEARLKLVLNEMGVLTSENYSNGRVQWAFLNKVWNIITAPYKNAKPACIAGVYGSYAGVGAVKGLILGSFLGPAGSAVGAIGGAIVGLGAAKIHLISFPNSCK